MADPTGDESVKNGLFKKKRSSDFQLEVAENGVAVIPPTDEIKTLRDKQAFIRQFFAHFYGTVLTWNVLLV
jgi:hypothetical protein